MRSQGHVRSGGRSVRVCDAGGREIGSRYAGRDAARGGQWAHVEFARLVRAYILTCFVALDRRIVEVAGNRPVNLVAMLDSDTWSKAERLLRVCGLLYFGFCVCRHAGLPFL